MGTRSLTYVYDGRSRIVCMYRQYDGYPTGHGAELADFLKPYRIVNGLGAANDNARLANGMSCLAAQLVAHFKTEPGQFYLMPLSRKLDAWQEYEYHVKRDSITVYDLYGEGDSPRRELFRGSWGHFFEWINQQGQKAA